MNLLGRKALREEKGRGKKKNLAILTGMSLLGDYEQDNLSLHVSILTFPRVGKAVRLSPPYLLCTCWRIFAPVLRGFKFLS